MGIELELEGVSPSSVEKLSKMGLFDKHWRITSDGSLRNNGVEFITTGGKGGADLHEAISSLCESISKVPHDPSSRCSTHVHVNMLDATKRQVLKFFLAYVVVEPLLFKTGGEYRKASNFCVPVSQAMQHNLWAIKRMAGRTGTIMQSGYMARVFSKYSAINLLPLYSDRPYGTVEFRGAGPITDAQQMLLLVNQLLFLKEFVMSFSGTEEEMLTEISNGAFTSGPFFPEDWEDLGCEECLVNAWVLLKAYKQALAREPEPARRQTRTQDSAAAVAALSRSFLNGNFAQAVGTAQPISASIDDVDF